MAVATHPSLTWAVSQARAVHPTVRVTAQVEAYVATRLEAIAACDDQPARAADVVVAGCCVDGDAAAQALVVDDLARLARQVAARFGMAASDDSEIAQLAQIALLSGSDGASPALARYSGAGSLRSYLRAVVVRTALKRRERDRPLASADDETLGLLPAAEDSPELRLIKQRGRGELRVALEDALAGLSPRQRNLLRQHYLDGLGIDALGRLYSIHRATAARWLERAHVDLSKGVRRHLQSALGLRPDELDSLMAAVTSQLDLSLSRLLRPG